MLRRMIPIIVFAAIAVTLAISLRHDPRQMPSTLIDKPVPVFELPPVLAGARPLSSSELSTRVTLLNVYASWCPGCQVEHPTLLRIASEGRIPLYGINWKDKPGQGARWLTRHRNPYIAAGEDANGRVGINLGVTGVPETFVIDDTGRIRYRHAGPITEDVWRDVFEPVLASLRSRQ